MRKIAIVGGAGFVGKQLASRLVSEGWQVEILTRSRERHRDLLVLPTARIHSVNAHDLEALTQATAGCEVVVNLIGILNETGNDGEGFRKAHVETTDNVIAACKNNGIKRLLHMSALNADAEQGTSYYLRTKGEAEALVHGVSELHVTSFRPSVIFGQDDSFFNRFAGLLKLGGLDFPWASTWVFWGADMPLFKRFLQTWTLKPYYFPLACPNAKFAPVWVSDVVSAMVKSINNPLTYGKRYDLCGPQTYTLAELVEMTAMMMGLQRRIIPMTDKASEWQAKLLEKVPSKPFSTDNLNSMKMDSVCAGEQTFAELGIQPSSVETIMPRYFGGDLPRDQYDGYRNHAKRA